MRSWFGSPRGKAALALLGGWVFFFARQIFSGDVPWARDNLLTYLPLRDHLHQRLLSGELPQWYPYEGLGVPLIGQIAVGTFHPATWLLLPLHFADAVRWNLLLAYLVASVGAYRFARVMGCSRPAAVAGGFAFAYGGYALGVSSLLPYAMSFATLPWAGWALWRLAAKQRPRDAAVLAACWALVFLAGDPQGLLFSVLLVPAAQVANPTQWPQRWRALAWVAAAGVVAGLLVGVELIPAQSSFADSLRVKGVAAPDLRSFWALAPARLLEVVVPGASPWRPPGEVFITTVFAGGCTVFLAALALRADFRRAAPLAAIGLLAVWLALGDSGGLLKLVQALVPPLGRFRYPEKYLAFLWVALAPLAALGLDALKRQPRSALAAFAAAVLFLVGAALGVPAALITAAVLGGLGAIGWLARTRPSALSLVPLLLLVELWNGNGAFLPLAERALLTEENPFARSVKAGRAGSEGPPRVIPELSYRVEDHTQVPTLDAARDLLALYPVSAAMSGVASLGPRLGALSTRYDQLLGAGGQRAKENGGWANACFRVGASRAEGDVELVDQVPSAGAQLYRRHCRPRAWLSGADAAATREEAIAWLGAHHFGDVTVVWERGPALAPTAGEVVWVRNDPERQVLQVNALGPAALVVADAIAPGWSASVDGQPTSLYPTLVALRGIAVPAGQHTVELVYRTPGLALGAGLSALGLVGLLALALGEALARRKGS